MADDYIKRSDAVFAVQKRIEQIGMGNNPYVCSIRQAVRDAPAADVKSVRHGRWVKMTGMMPPEFHGHYSCSECDWFCKNQSVKETEFDFCPGCGAKMREEVSNDTTDD